MQPGAICSGWVGWYPNTMKFAPYRPYSDPEKAARKIVEIAKSVEPGQEGRIYIELINGPFPYREKGTPDEYKAGLDLAIERGWLVLHESGTFVKFAEGEADMLRPEVAGPLAPTI